MSRSPIDLVHIAQVLNKHNVDYVLVGGMAVILQGRESATLDVDLAFDRSGKNIERLADALEELSAKPKRWVTAGYRLKLSALGTAWLHLESDFGDIDLISSIRGLSYDAVRQNCDRFEIDAISFSVASIQQLIEMKSQTGREKDAIHIAELQQLLDIQKEDI